MSYYDIDQILAEEEKIPSTFRIGGKKLGYLDPGHAEDDDLKADTRVELPLWLAQILYTATFVTLDLPKHYRPAFRNHLLADPSVPTLPPYYYAVGQRLALLTKNEELLKMLQSTFFDRYKGILDKAYHAGDSDSTEFTIKLSEIEKKLFKAGQAVAYEADRSRIKNAGRGLSMSDHLRKKRKFDDV